MLPARLWIPALFAVLALVYGALALKAASGAGAAADPRVKAHRRIALVFAAVSVFLFVLL